MKRIMQNTALLALFLQLLSGCATVIVRDYPSCKANGPTSVYPATVFDGCCIVTGGGNLEGKIHPAGYLLLSPFWLLDLPLSLVADTVLFPCDLYRSSKKQQKNDLIEPQSGGYPPPVEQPSKPIP